MNKLLVVCAALLAVAAVFVYKTQNTFETLPRLYTVHASTTEQLLKIAPRVSAQAFVVFDNETGEEIFARSASSRHEMASVVKLITAETLLEQPQSTLASTATISWQALAPLGDSGLLDEGERYPLRELLFPLLLSSSNDAAEAIALSRGHSAFLTLMRIRTKAIGMSSTTLDDLSGLSPRTTTTARDLASLLRFLYRENRHVLDITTLPRYVGTHHTWQNTDPIARLSGFMGGKQGHTDTAQSTLAALFAMPTTERAQRTVGIVLLGSKDLEGDTKAILKALH